MHLSAPIPPQTATLVKIPDGPAGTRATLDQMKRFVLAAKSRLSVAMTAREILRDAGVSQGNAKEWGAQIRAIFDFVQRRISYVRDIIDVETLQSPEATLVLGTGDCDDKSTLAAALLASIGHPSRFVAMRFEPHAEFSHVILETRIGARWLALDCTLDYPLGYAPPADERMVVHI